MKVTKEEYETVLGNFLLSLSKIEDPIKLQEGIKIYDKLLKEYEEQIN